MTTPYTDDDLRTEAARQYAEVLRAPDRLEVGDEMRDQPVPSQNGSVRWGQLSCDDFHDARNEVHELLDSAVDMSAWSVNLGARHLKTTTELAWGRGGDAWDLAVQIAHRPGLSTELRDALTTAIRGAVNLVLDNRELNDTHLLHDSSKETAR
ncbi:hypothetical protein [Streptomyces sp. NPDC088794]|uniref:hypothetical protein n=1 Tax=Streptomyces sp. NPDC088794 TaxID=3365902 RepID=UPI0038137E35